MCAVWNDQNGSGKVQIWRLNNTLAKVDAMDEKKSTIAKLTSEKPIYSFSGHTAPGFALAWNSLKTGTLASGDNHKKVSLGLNMTVT